MTDDLISRQAAIDLFPNDVLEWDTFYGYIAPHEARRLIKELPSTQKTGKWIDMDEQSYTWKVRCSVCGHERSMMSTQGEYPNYCEHCGARMDAEDDKWI